MNARQKERKPSSGLAKSANGDRTKMIFGVVGAGFGFVVGSNLIFRQDFGLWPMVIMMVAAAGTGACAGIGMHRFIEGNFVNSRDARYKRDRIAALAGTAIGLYGGRQLLAFRPEVGWQIVPAAMLVGAVLVGLIFDTAQVSHKSSKPTEKQKSIPLGKIYVAEWKLERVQKLLATDDIVPASNETALSVLTEQHVIGLFASLGIGAAIGLFFYWGSWDFVYFQDIVRVFRNDAYRLGFLGVVLVLTALWVRNNRKRLRALAVKAGLYTLVIVLLWIGFRAPWAQELWDALRAGEDWTWYLGIVPCVVWMAVRFVIWRYWFYASTDARAITGTVMPWPLPNFNPALIYPANSADPKDTVLGRIAGYGHAILDGAGTMDWLFNNLRFIKGHRDFTNSVPRKG